MYGAPVGVLLMLCVTLLDQKKKNKHPYPFHVLNEDMTFLVVKNVWAKDMEWVLEMDIFFSPYPFPFFVIDFT